MKTKPLSYQIVEKKRWGDRLRDPQTKGEKKFSERIDNTLKYVTNTLDINKPGDNLRRLADLSVNMDCRGAQPTEKTTQKMQFLIKELVNKKLGVMNDADSIDRIYRVFPEVETVMSLGMSLTS